MKKFVLVVAVDTEIDYIIFDKYIDAYMRMKDFFADSDRDIEDKIAKDEAGIDDEYAWVVDGKNHDNYAYRIIEVEYEEEKYVVYTEIHNPNSLVERWYYGTYSHERANAVADELGTRIDELMETRVYHCVCKANEARSLGIQNLPKTLDN